LPRHQGALARTVIPNSEMRHTMASYLGRGRLKCLSGKSVNRRSDGSGRNPNRGPDTLDCLRRRVETAALGSTHLATFSTGPGQRETFDAWETGRTRAVRTGDRSMSSGRNWPLHPKTPYCRSPGLPSGCCYFFEPGLGWGCTLLQARQSRFRKAARHSAAEVSLVPSECTSISIKAGEYGMGKWISDSRAESGVAVKYRRSSKLCCPGAVAKTAIV
jgi:hypothetical protein